MFCRPDSSPAASFRGFMAAGRRELAEGWLDDPGMWMTVLLRNGVEGEGVPSPSPRPTLNMARCCPWPVFGCFCCRWPHGAAFLLPAGFGRLWLCYCLWICFGYDIVILLCVMFVLCLRYGRRWHSAWHWLQGCHWHSEIAIAAPTTPLVTVTEMLQLRCGRRLFRSRNEDVVRGDLVWPAL